MTAANELKNGNYHSPGSNALSEEINEWRTTIGQLVQNAKANWLWHRHIEMPAADRLHAHMGMKINIFIFFSLYFTFFTYFFFLAVTISSRAKNTVYSGIINCPHA